MAPGSRTAKLGERTVTRVGLGTNRLTDTEENREFLRAALDAGLDFIDTAHVYTDGASETTIGNALAPFPEGVTVATKGGYQAEGGVEALRSELEQSFRSLQAETIALYYVHRLHADERPIEETLGLLAEYRDGGRIEHVGLSDVSIDEIEDAREIVPIAAVQNEHNLSKPDDEVIGYCEAEGILYVPFFPLRGNESSQIEDAAERAGASPNQVTLAWHLGRSPAVAPIPGTLSLEHLRENLAALDLELSDTDLTGLRG